VIVAATAGRGIVTPEAVLLEFEMGGVGSRTVARLIDLVLQIMIVIFGIFAIGTVLSPVLSADYGAAIVASLAALVVFLALFGYPTFMELRFGATVGKFTMGLRVVTVEGGPLRFRHAAIRALLQVVDVWLIPIGVIGVISMLLSTQSRRLGDLAAGTVVLRQPSTALRSIPVAFFAPPGLQPYVATLDASAVTAEQYGVIRLFLMRALRLSPEARAALGYRLAGAVAARIHQPVPGWLPPETFLVCVASAYQRRHGGHVAFR
jgi:uncharacterized RDD family membrane protein YckC